MTVVYEEKNFDLPDGMDPFRVPARLRDYFGGDQMTIAKNGETISTTLNKWKATADGLDVGSALSGEESAELVSSGPQRIADVLDSIMNDKGLFPTFSFYTVYDTKMRGHLEPQHFVNDMVACREWRDRLMKGHHFMAAPRRLRSDLSGRLGSGQWCPDPERRAALRRHHEGDSRE